MEFWGVEVKSGQSLKVQPDLGKLIHISQAALGEVKDGKGAKHVPLHLKIDDKKFIIGSLSAEDRTQLMFDLVFEREFELSHGWKNGSVYFIGYMADDPVSDGEEFSDEFDDVSEDEPVDAQENGDIKAKPAAGKPGKTAVAKAGAKKEEQPGIEEDEGDSESDSDDEMGEDDDSEDGVLDTSVLQDSEDGADADADSDEEEKEVPKYMHKSKKRSAEPAQETSVPSKKVKAATPDKTGSKKGQAASPSKAVGKTPAGNKAKEQTPKSGGGQISCKTCNKNFNSPVALQSHTKAKHGGK